MATANYTGRPSNKSQWQPTIPVDQSIYEESSTQKAPLGTRLEVGDRVFYYGKVSASAAVTPGYVLSAPQMVASHQADILTPIAANAGVTSVQVTLGAAMTKNQYAEGYMIVSSGTGAGMSYRIKSNVAALTAATATIVLYDPIAEPMTATSEVNFIPNLYNGVKIGSEVLDTPIGVTVSNVTAGNYAWLQTAGPASVFHTAATPAANAVKMGTLGAVAVYNTATTSPLATALCIGRNFNLAATSAEQNPIFLSIRK